ncbi:uncharacterized protein [Watersipora subatra]|uniref:uncharacterized protein n=1 Tax=Watersipora subatra TaxID=2589382 RepID=UPI00355B929A
MSGQGLSVIVSLPEEIVKLETLGILFEGCETFGANVIEDFEADVSDACRTSCSYDSPKLNSAYVDECAYDCTYGVTEYRETYYDIDDHIAIVRDDNAATSKAPSNILFALILAIVFSMT